MRFVPKSTRTASGERHFDVAGALSVTAGLIVLTFAIVRTDVNGWGSTQTLVIGAIGIALLVLFVFIERHALRPLVPMRIFHSRTLTAANLVVFTLGASVFAMWYFVSLYLQQVLGYSPIRAGLSFVPMTGAIVVASTFAGRNAERIGPGRLLTAGMSLITVGMLLFTRISADGSWASDVLLSGVVSTTGIGLAFVPATITAVAGVARSDSGLAGGLVNTSRQMGGSLGLAILATLATQRTQDLAGNGPIDANDVVAGFHRAFVVGAGFAAVGALIALLLLVRVRHPAARPRQAPPAEQPAEAERPEPAAVDA
jgi:predicted MFS family arabinose efflux permease